MQSFDDYIFLNLLPSSSLLALHLLYSNTTNPLHNFQIIFIFLIQNLQPIFRFPILLLIRHFPFQQKFESQHITLQLIRGLFHFFFLPHYLYWNLYMSLCIWHDAIHNISVLLYNNHQFRFCKSMMRQRWRTEVVKLKYQTKSRAFLLQLVYLKMVCIFDFFLLFPNPKVSHYSFVIICR